MVGSFDEKIGKCHFQLMGVVVVLVEPPVPPPIRLRSTEATSSQPVAEASSEAAPRERAARMFKLREDISISPDQNVKTPAAPPPVGPAKGAMKPRGAVFFAGL